MCRRPITARWSGWRTAEPIREEGTLDERLHAYMVATMTGNSQARARAVPRPCRGRGGAPGFARNDRVSRPDRSAGHGDRPQGAQHRPQGDPRPRGHRPRQLHRLGEFARRLLHGRARHGGRPALLFAVRSRLRAHQRRVPGRCRQEPEKDQPDAAVAARGRGDARRADDGRSGHRVQPDHGASEERANRSRASATRSSSAPRS